MYGPADEMGGQGFYDTSTSSDSSEGISSLFDQNAPQQRVPYVAVPAGSSPRAYAPNTIQTVPRMQAPYSPRPRVPLPGQGVQHIVPNMNQLPPANQGQGYDSDSSGSVGLGRLYGQGIDSDSSGSLGLGRLYGQGIDSDSSGSLGLSRLYGQGYDSDSSGSLGLGRLYGQGTDSDSSGSLGLGRLYGQGYDSDSSGSVGLNRLYGHGIDSDSSVGLNNLYPGQGQERYYGSDQSGSSSYYSSAQGSPMGAYNMSDTDQRDCSFSSYKEDYNDTSVLDTSGELFIPQQSLQNSYPAPGRAGAANAVEQQAAPLYDEQSGIPDYRGDIEDHQSSYDEGHTRMPEYYHHHG